jgi:murein L,D-transpeptidase YafK
MNKRYNPQIIWWLKRKRLSSEPARISRFAILLLGLLLITALSSCHKHEKVDVKSFHADLMEIEKNLNDTKVLNSEDAMQKNTEETGESNNAVKEEVEKQDSPVSVQKAPEPVAVQRELIPDNLVGLPDGDHVLICEKKTRNLYLFHYAGGEFSFIKKYPVIVGKNHNDKTSYGDFATPEGIYFITRVIPGKSLPARYGWGAFPLNYPNLLDRKEGKTGNGIWLHGHDPKQKLEDILTTRGCVAIDNDYLMELAQVIKPDHTFIVIANEIALRSPEDQDGSTNELKGFFDSWKQAWESLDTAKYLSFYSPDFITSDGMDYQRFKLHKERVNRDKSFIEIKSSNEAMLTFRKNGKRIAVIRFDQSYVSNNFNTFDRKILYLEKNGEEKWQIVGEDRL